MEAPSTTLVFSHKIYTAIAYIHKDFKSIQYSTR